MIHQFSAVEPWEAAEEAVIEYPALFRHPLTSELREQIMADGFVHVPCERAGRDGRGGGSCGRFATPIPAADPR